VGSLEDPDKGRPVHMRAKKKRLYHSNAKEGKCDSKTVKNVETLCFEKATCA